MKIRAMHLRTPHAVIYWPRILPQRLSIMPSHVSSSGGADVAAKLFAQHEIQLLQEKCLQLNDWLGEKVVQFSVEG